MTELQKLKKKVEKSNNLSSKQKEKIIRVIEFAENAKTREQVIKALEVILSILGVSLKILLVVHGFR